VEVFAVVVMGNHLHIVVRAPGKNVAAFTGYFLARVAQTLNLLLGRVGPVFPRRHDAQPTFEEADVILRP
jgi:REP element-mobilizing transposase RayT